MEAWLKETMSYYILNQLSYGKRQEGSGVMWGFISNLLLCTLSATQTILYKSAYIIQISNL